MACWEHTRALLRVALLSWGALVAPMLAGCAQGGGGDGGMPRADVADRDGALGDGGALDGGSPRLPVRSTHAGVASGHVSSSARYRLVLSTASSGSTASPSSSRYVLREHVIGRIAEPRE